MYSVYAIGLKDDLVPPYVNCYIGVTNNLKSRFKAHHKSNYTIGRFIREYDLSYPSNMVVIFSGSKDDCFSLELKYRPSPNLGLNEATGGKGGYTRYSKERNLKISDSLKGRSVTWKDKISKTKVDNNQSVGSKNGMAKCWKVTTPDGNVYHIKGTLSLFCNEHGIIARTLTYYKNSKVPHPKKNKMGGFRAKNEQHRVRRNNTTGWKLEEI